MTLPNLIYIVKQYIQDAIKGSHITAIYAKYLSPKQVFGSSSVLHVFYFKFYIPGPQNLINVIVKNITGTVINAKFMKKKFRQP